VSSKKDESGFKVGVNSSIKFNIRSVNSKKVITNSVCGSVDGSLKSSSIFNNRACDSPDESSLEKAR
jgi:hypothetical protein